jgi:hypothetical protein
LKNRKYSEAGIAAQTESSNLITLIVIFLWKSEVPIFLSIFQ